MHHQVVEEVEDTVEEHLHHLLHPMEHHQVVEEVVDTAAEHLLHPMEHLQVVVEDSAVEHLQDLQVHTVLLQRQRP